MNGKLLIIASILAGLLLWRTAGTNSPKAPMPPPAAPETATNVVHCLPPSFTKRAMEYSPAEREELEKLFNAKFKPALEKWFKVYGNRVPFTLEDVTLDKFHSRLAGYLYTFMIGDTTLTIADSKSGTRVFYMMTRNGAVSLNSIPKGGAAPDISTPVARDEIVRMLKADSGIDYPPDQIQIRPTGTFSALGGGVMVEAGGIDGNGVYRAMTNTNLDFVLGADGKLVSYQH